MKKFTLINASTMDEAASGLRQPGGKAAVFAGGTDLFGIMKGKILPEYPEVVVNINTIPGLNYIKEEAGVLKIGALALIEDIAEDTTILSKYTALAQAARAVGTPQLRNMGTIGGNICQSVRCWYYRSERNYFNCLRKNPSGICPALVGDNRYNSIFGTLEGCIAVNPSDMAPALVALDASVVTTKRTIAIEDFFTVNGEKTTVLDDDEIVTEIQVPTPAAGTKSAFVKFALRKALDFPIVNCAAAISGSDARICLNAVYNNPHRATEAEDVIKGQTINDANAEAAGAAAVAGATALPGDRNKYMIQIAKTMVKRAILACA